MPNNPPRWYNKRVNNNLARHEIFFGIKNRQKSIEDGLVVFLTPELHNMSNYGVHFNPTFDMELKELGQKVWMEYYNKTEEDFIKRYGRNYIGRRKRKNGK